MAANGDGDGLLVEMPLLVTVLLALRGTPSKLSCWPFSCGRVDHDSSSLITI